MDNTQYTESEFNMAVSTLNRINSLLAEYNSYEDIFFEQRFEILKKLYEEVYPFEFEKDPNSIKDYDKLIENIGKDSKDFVARKAYTMRFNQPLLCKTSLIKNMMDLSKKIRSALYKHHLLIKIGKDPKKAIIL